MTRPKIPNPPLHSHFFDPTQTDLTPEAVAAKVSWIAFPKLVKTKFPDNEARWRIADGLDPSLQPDAQGRYVQDEYCEWSVERDKDTGKVRKVTFTCEGPEYWTDFLAKQKDKVVELYKTHVSPDVNESDLFEGDSYNPENKWNRSTTDGAMHLIQRNNTLSAEIILAADATVVRKNKKGEIVTDQRLLIERCSQYGASGRNSDPFIGYNVNQLVVNHKAFVTLQNPVGLFFNALDTTGWQTPDGTDPQEFWKYTRGNADKPIRAVYEVPPEKGFMVGDITINDEPIKYGGQIADSITIKLTAVADRLNQEDPTPFPCLGEPQIKGLSPLSVELELNEGVEGESALVENSEASKIYSTRRG